MRLGFAVNGSGTALVLEMSPKLSAAYDVLTGDGMPPEKAADMAAAAERDGRDPVAFAEHVVKLRRSLRDRSA